MISWRRNLYVLFAVQLLSTAGFSLVFPFLPLYVKELGVATRGSVEFWSGLVFSSQAATMMLSSPIWGTIADRYGRKLMLIRATLGGAVLIALMGFCQNVEQLVILRTIQGCVTGVISAANALVAATTPRDRTGGALGLLMLARYGGIALGPVIGGIIGDMFGFRESFWITGALLGIAGLAVIFWVHEDFQPVARSERPGILESYRRLITAPGMGGLYTLGFLRSLGQMITYPVLSLFIIELMGQQAGAASITGLMIGSAAFTSAISSVYLGRLGDRIGHNRILLASAVAAVLLTLPQPFVTAAWQLAILQGLSGFAVGGLLPTTAALMNLWAPTGNQGATYALDNSVAAAGRSLAPMVGAAAAIWFGIRGAFGMAALAYLLILALAFHVVRSASAEGRVTRGQALKTAGD
ncbi:MFS transporter [Litorilinea aerophila]|uniref:Multidrug efflux MFS transporter n=1 Tax=Litorilinea aerophila TaxID=1204385 RepID=A0A540VKR6_9CHLR|nr:MFS transporter [Litorilinea aerophila]MCC9075039.1 MFS transporter [Litorilinea aerophila]